MSVEQINELIALYNQGMLQEALVQGEALAKQLPEEPFIPNLLGIVYLGSGRLEQAAANFTRALQLRPDYVEAHTNLGNTLFDLGRPEEAVASCNKALQVQPDFAEAHNNLGNTLNALGRPEEAIASCNKALQIKPDFAEAHNNLGNALNALGRPEEAVDCYNKALQIQPGFAEAHNNLGNALNNLGRPEDAVASCNKALQVQPDCAEAHQNLSAAKEFQDGDPQIQQMLQLVSGHDLSDKDRMHLNFALAKACGDIGSHDRAFAYLADGNRLRLEELKYEISSDREPFAKTKAVFSENVPVLDVGKEPEGAKSQLPVFILGMPRSGTSLVEQILASHSQVYGVGEMKLLGQSVNSIKRTSGQLSSDQLQSIRKSYLSGLKRIGAAEPYITDKMPLNFTRIGFIFAALPEAKVIHVIRDARATCWSNFKSFFAEKGNDFAYDLQDVTEYYKMYIDLMSFWQRKFPGRIYDLNYEALTEHQEDETRRLLEHVGLSWEDQCLEFYKTKRAIRTVSAAQVRQKMYQGSSKDWRKYEKHLEPMVESLRGL